jgi:cell wall-associated NlpC family hydrolase
LLSGGSSFVLPTAARLIRHIVVSLACVFVLAGATTVFAASSDEAALDPGALVANVARGQVGARYRWGGTSPAGFDCTGFVKWVYSQVGVDLPRNEAGQLASGERVGADELQPGDLLVFANTYRRGLSHVGIYLGDSRFVHAVNERHGVTVSNLWDGYWSPRFVAASRVATA